MNKISWKQAFQKLHSEVQADMERQKKDIDSYLIKNPGIKDELTKKYHANQKYIDFWLEDAIKDPDFAGWYYDERICKEL